VILALKSILFKSDIINIYRIIAFPDIYHT
jgi:hypothetical protein